MLFISYVQLVGVAVIFLIIAAHNFESLVGRTAVHFCDWTLIITAAMVPVSMLGTPKDFWPIAVGAMVCTAFACLLIFIQSMREITSPLPPAEDITFK